MSIVIRNTDLYDEHGMLQKEQSICIAGDTIACITNDPQIVDAFVLRQKGKAEMIDGRGYLVMPGLVNAHTHSPMVLLRNIGSDLPLQQWLFREIIPRECQLTPEEIYNGSLAAQIEMIRSGITGYCDMYEPFEALARAAEDGGMRVNLCSAPLHNDWSGPVKRTYADIEKTENFIRTWNHAAAGRIRTYVELHSVYLYDRDLLHFCVECAGRTQTGIHMHLHETVQEVTDCIRETGKRPIEFLKDLGAFDVPVIAAHCVEMTEHDIEILKEKGVCVAANMTSNLKLASGIAPVPEFLNAGIPVALGTDGAASNNNLNLFEEMHLAALIYKGVRRDPLLVSARQAVKMATEYGARALGFGGRSGVLKEGMLADLIMVDMSAIHLQPVHDINACIVYAMQGADVDTVIINGTTVMRRRTMTKLDEEKIKWGVEHVAFKR